MTMTATVRKGTKAVNVPSISGIFVQFL